MALAVLLVAGCIEPACPGCDRDPRAGADALLSHRGRVEARLPDGSWQPVSDWPTFAIPVFWMNQTVALEESVEPTPLGGGGQAVPVAPGAPVTVALRVVPESLAPGGTVEWVRLDASGFFDPAEDPQVPLGSAPIGEPFAVSIDRPGITSFAVKVFDEAGRLVFYSFTTEDVHLGGSWTFEGQVQPQHPRDGAGPFVDPEAMADRFQLPEWAWGGHLLARLEYRGVWVPGMGADLNLALYDASMLELQCGRTDGVGPAATSETLDVPIREQPQTEGHTFEAWVGYTPGFFCDPSFDEGYYANPTPVPYRLRLEVWPKTPAFLA